MATLSQKTAIANWFTRISVRVAVSTVARSPLSASIATSVGNTRRFCNSTGYLMLSLPTPILPRICAETSRLASVICCPNNAEARFVITAGAKSYSPETPYCGRTKYYRPTTLAANLDALGDVPDLFQTAEWFGAGGRAFRLTLASWRFIELARTRGWRGLTFREVEPNHSYPPAPGNPRSNS